jgi:uncharacterized membrane protein YbhN (UPF0104 family)
VKLYHRHRRALTVVASVAATAALVIALAGKSHDFTTALHSASAPILLAAVALQLVALLSRTEAWRICVNAAGGSADRRRLYRASSMGFVGSLVNAQVGVAARIAALRKSAPTTSPGIAPLIGAELPIMAIEATLGAVASFTLIGPLGLPWWAPLIALAVTLGVSTGLRSVALRSGRGVLRGLAVLRANDSHASILAIVLIAVFAQIARNWLLLNAVGVSASPLDATALLIAQITLSQLPLGPATGAAATVLILGPHGVAAAAAAGVLLTATGTAGGLVFAAWAVSDRLWCGGRAALLRRRVRSWLRPAAARV